MPLPSVVAYEFGPYRIDSAERLLRRGDELIPLPPKVALTLLALVENAGRMVDKSDLMKIVWPDTFVEEGALTRNISLLRKTLGDTGDEPVYIETIPRRGYRFVAPVRTGPFEAPSPTRADNRDQPEPLAPPPAPPPSRARLKALATVLVLAGAAIAAFTYKKNDTPAVTATPRPSNMLAVLAFRNVDQDASQSYFADGMTQALIDRLGKVRNLRIASYASAGISLTDADARAEILRNPAIKRVLTGTIQRSGGRIQIYAQLLDPRTWEVYWTRNYERKTEDVLDLESEVAEAIAGEIEAGITARDREHLRERRQTSPEAYDAYLRGLSFWNRRTEDGLKRAAEEFQRAIKADSSYAPAYAGLADSHSLLGSIGTDGMPPEKAMPLAKAAAEKAVELDPDLADGYTSLAYIKLSYDWDLPAAEKDFSRALELNPNSATAHHWYSHYFMAAGDLAKATEQMHEALRLEPLSPSINIGIGWCLYYSQKYDEAIEQFRSVTESDPALPLAHQTLGMAYQQKGWFDRAIEEFKRAAAYSNNSPASVAALASAYAAMGRTAEARQELARLEEMARTRYVPAFYFASVHYALGDLARTFTWGWKAIGERCDYLMYLRVEPRVGKLAGNPEFVRALAAIHR